MNNFADVIPEPHPQAGNDTEIIKWKEKNGMKSDAKSLSLFIGWDVGGWDCDNKPNIRGAMSS